MPGVRLPGSLFGITLAAMLAAAPSHADVPPPGQLLFANGFDRPTAAAGGVNYLWYRLGSPGDVCDREPYGLLVNYQAPGVRVVAQQQLASMHARGMRSLSLGIAFVHGATSSGTLVDSSDAAAVALAADNLGLLLADAQVTGFERVLFRFFPQGAISPSNDAHGYSGSSDPLLLEYWNLVVSMRTVLAASGMPYRIDLMVEGAPADSNSPFYPDKWNHPADKDWSNAVRELWHRYSSAYGSADTVGFSFLTSSNRARQRVRHMKYVYAGDYPHTFAMDFYGGENESESDQFVVMAGLMQDYGTQYGFTGASWIISETWYNDPLAAAGLSSAIAASGQAVLWLAEWPLDRGAACDQVSEPPPYEFDIWHLYGF